ncbi:hypothetical protein FRB94_013121 [Tulasnella sp. JGI-2019a]|nr:hypothetical protein FRB93_001582 [Tulasnella sp. JGI-2019a]KAG9008508.1 hypothetical protein FRB94_013121 [Tulasnella sp. JGI-2019a]KAG9034834.1 hypothetical protein FRB95_012527 [Tulasnella sp. JGI-2019a]
MSDTMKAILIKDGKGPVENLYIGDAERPRPKEKGQVIVKVKMFGLNRMDLIQREGKYPVPPNTTPILGVEFSGTIAEIAPDVTSVKVGDEVMGLAYGGAYAQYVMTYDHMVAPKPAHLSFVEAAGIPEVWLTAYQALFLVGKLQKGESVMIHAGASGVGIAANQLARRFGAKHVITTAGSAEKLDFLKSMPYAPTHTVNYKTEDFSEHVKEITSENGVDVIVDFIGKDYWDKNISSLARDGRLVYLAFMSGDKVPSFSIAPILYKRLSILGTTLRSRTLEYQGDLMVQFKENALPDILSESAKPEVGGLRSYVHDVYPWTEIQRAHREMQDNKTSGKIVLEVTE